VGQVTFTSLSQEPIEIPAGTTLRTSHEDGIRFKTLHSISLNGEIGDEVEVPIEALTPGWGGNVPARSICFVDGPLGLLVQLTNKEPTNGGRNEIRRMVLQEDLDQIERDLMNELVVTAERNWYDGNPSEYILVGGSLELLNILDREFDHLLGEVADTLTLKLTLEYSALALSKDDLRNLVRVEFLEPQRLKYLPQEEGFKFSSKMQGSLEGSNDRYIDVEVKVDTFPALEVGLAKQGIRGQKPSAAEEFLQGIYPTTSTPMFQLKPGWYPVLPLVDQRIDFVWTWE
jgi:hypothetical protein